MTDRSAKALDLRKLRNVLEVAERKSLTKAATVLGMAQSVLSKDLRDTEELLGDRLFHRTGRGVEATEFAEKVLPQISSLIVHADQLFDYVHEMRGVPRGSVRLALISSLSGLLLTPLLTEIAERFPEIKIRVQEGLTHHVEEWLALGAADLAIVYGRGPHPAPSDEFLTSVDLYLIGARCDPLLAQPEISLSQLAGLPFLLPAQPNRWRSLMEEAFSANHIPLTISYEIDSIQTIKELVAQWRQYSVLPLHAISTELERGNLVASKIIEPGMTRQIQLLFAKLKPPSRATAEVASVIRHVMQQVKKTKINPLAIKAEHRSSG